MVFRDKRYQEIAGIAVLLAGVLVFLSLASYRLADADLLAASRPVNNLIGPFGALISGALRTAFGYSSYLVIAIIALAGWSVLKNGNLSGSLEKILSLVYLTVVSSPLVASALSTRIPQFSGGVIGEYLSRLLTALMNPTGATLFIILLNLTGLMLLGLFSVAGVVISSAAGKGALAEGISKLRSGLKNRRLHIPQNRIERAMNSRRKEKMPWITKKRIALYDNAPVFESDPFAERKLLPLNNPVYTGFGPDAGEPADESPRTLFSRGIEYDPAAGASAREWDGAAPFSLPEPAEPQMSIYDTITLTGDEDPYRAPGNRITTLDAAEEIAPPIDVEILEEAIQEEDDDEGIAFDSAQPSRTVERVSFLPDDNGAFDGADTDTPREVFQRVPLTGKYDIPTSFLTSSTPKDIESWKSEIRRNSELLVGTLRDFGIESRVINVNRGPVITLYEMQIAAGIKVNRVVALSDDIAMALAASRVRIVAPIPGKSAVGVEVPNLEREMVTLGDIIKSPEYRSATGRLKVALGEDILGVPVTLDIKKLPHLLIAGSTGSGKSVCVNSIITSLIYNYTPDHVRFIMVDPKMVELQLYNGLPHLLTPVITEPHIAPRALKWAMFEMERRYRLLSEAQCRDIDRYNDRVSQSKEPMERLPYIVIIMDELADLMMVAAKEIEGYITRIAQKARAVGIHLVLATQRPSVDVITGIIKANFPARIAFQVAQKTDSRTIIDQNGAEKLLGKGDMLYQSPMSSFPVRIQGAFISEDEVIAIAKHLRRLGKPAYIDIESSFPDEEDDADFGDENDDELFLEALKIVEETKKASASYLQRRLSIGYNRAARMVELMEERGYIGPQQGSRPREVFI